MGPLISPARLFDEIDDVSLFDIRWDLIDPQKGMRDYEAGHIPGAVFVDLDHDLAGPPGDRGRHPLPSTDEFAGTLGRLGVKPGSRVVVYDDVGGRYAARMWWMLEAIEHESVRVLDGGLQGWVDAGGRLEAGSVRPSPSTYPVPDGFSGSVTHDELEGRSLIDARAGERYRGDVEPVDPKAGHIPGAVNLPTGINLDKGGSFRDPDALREVYTSVGERPVVSCGSGVTACHSALAMRVAGLEMPDVYVGSFSEWSRLDLPVSTGHEP